MTSVPTLIHKSGVRPCIEHQWRVHPHADDERQCDVCMGVQVLTATSDDPPEPYWFWRALPYSPEAERIFRSRTIQVPEWARAIW